RTLDTPSRAGAVKVAHFARPRGLDLDGSEHGGRMECAGASRTLPVPPLELGWRQVAERGMPTVRIVEAFDELEDGIARLGLRLEPAASQQLAFQRGKETLGHRIVIGIAHASHRRPHTRFTAAVAKLNGRVL